MKCPRCRTGRLVGEPTAHRTCDACGLVRRPNDRVVHRRDTNFYTLNRNIKRTPPGSLVELIKREGTCLEGQYGVFKLDADGFMLRAAQTGFIIASSDDMEDLAILVTEHEWRIEGPDDFIEAVGSLCDD